MVKKRLALSPLTVKLFRDIKSQWKSFVATTIICFLSVTLYLGIDASWRAIELSLEKQFVQSQMADVWVRGDVSDRMVRDIEVLDGVAVAQRRTLVSTKAETLEGEPTVTLIMNEGEPLLNIPLLLDENDILPISKDTCILPKTFADAHNLKKGDILHLTHDNRHFQLTIAAIGYMPEYVVTSDGNEIATSAFRFGYAYVPYNTLGNYAANEVAIKIDPSADADSVIRSIRTLYSDRTLAVTERNDIPGIRVAMEEAQQIQAMGAIFPVVFFIIAALITWTTMSRLVENQRLQIGSLFAIGYERKQLLWHYAGYGLILAILGALSGFIGARLIIAPILLKFLETMMFLPGAYPYMSPVTFLLISLLLIIITGGASLLSAFSALKNTPAALMRPKPPSKGQRVFLENIQGLWTRMRFSSKMILRNILRNRSRLFLGLFGALGCSALMLTGFGLRDSVNRVMVSHYENTMQYDVRVMLDANTPSDYAKSIALRTNADSYETQMITALDVQLDGQWRSKVVYILEDEHKHIRLMTNGTNQIQLPKDGLCLTRKAAEDYGVQLGDILQLRIPGGRGIAVPIVQLIDLQLDQGIYLSQTAFKKINLMPYMPTDVLLSGNGIDLDAAQAMDGVSKVRTLQQEKDNNNQTMLIMSLVVIVLVLFSGALAFVVFYNLGQLNFSERMRELATLKVLGFTPKEMKQLVLTENILITIMGLPLGLFAGPFLLNAVLTYGLPNTIHFIPYISPLSWVLTSILTICFSAIVNLILSKKFKSIDMVEALKSVE